MGEAHYLQHKYPRSSGEIFTSIPFTIVMENDLNGTGAKIRAGICADPLLPLCVCVCV